ncbi:MAG: helix-turn-helix domain-containing protein [Holosporales bacterium]|nr:helix-turn-helix domain-containing protein [Holosporales bacterium]
MSKSTSLKAVASSSSTSAPIQSTQTSPEAAEKILLKTRLGKKLNLRDISRTLCINESVLQAIEEEHWDSISQEKTYVLGFIKAYGKFLQVPITDILERYKSFTKEKTDSTEIQEENLEEKSQKIPSKAILLSSCLLCLILIFFLNPYFQFSPKLDLSNEFSEPSASALPPQPPAPYTFEGAPKDFYSNNLIPEKPKTFDENSSFHILDDGRQEEIKKQIFGSGSVLPFAGSSDPQ